MNIKLVAAIALAFVIGCGGEPLPEVTTPAADTVAMDRDGPSYGLKSKGESPLAWAAYVDILGGEAFDYKERMTRGLCGLEAAMRRRENTPAVRVGIAKGTAYFGWYGLAAHNFDVAATLTNLVPRLEREREQAKTKSAGYSKEKKAAEAEAYKAFVKDNCH